MELGLRCEEIIVFTICIIFVNVNKNKYQETEFLNNIYFL